MDTQSKPWPTGLFLHRVVIDRRTAMWMSALVIPFVLLAAGSLPAEAVESASDSGRVLDELKALESDVLAMAGRCSDATVCIVAAANGRTGAGSGVVVSEDGLILTAAHVLDGLGDEATVFFPNGRMVKAKLLGSDFDHDAAMLQITKAGTYPHVELSDRREVAENQWCVAMGHPGGFNPERPPVLRWGRVLVSGDFILTDCIVVGGDSGGPLFDAEGRLIGIHSSIGFGLNENRHVPVTVFRDAWERLKAGERYGSRFSSHVDDAESEAPTVFGAVDDEGKDDLDRFLDGAVNPGTGQTELRVTPDVIKRFGSVETIMQRLSERSASAADDKPGPENKTPNREPDGGPGMKAPTSGQPRDQGAGASGLELLELMAKARTNGGQMELTPELLEKMGGMEGLMKQLKSLGLTGDGVQPSGMSLPEELKTRDAFMESILQATTAVTETASPSVATVLVGNSVQSLATVVGTNGYLVAPTVADRGDLSVRLGDRVLAAKLVADYRQYGLTLLKVEAVGLDVVDWAGGAEIAKVGTFVIAPAPGDGALGLGMVGVEERNTIETPFLGVQNGQAEDGELVKAIAAASPADQAGIRVGDVIRSISGKRVSKAAMPEVLKQFSAGDSVDVEIQRDGKTLTLTATLGPSLFSMQAESLRAMNSMSGPLSSRETGFARALQHDIPLAPAQCGGPLLNLKGQCIGINVSRAGRIETLAIPATTVTDLVKGDVDS